MKELVCGICGKKIEGYTKDHIEHLMQQHNLKHERESKKSRKTRM